MCNIRLQVSRHNCEHFTLGILRTDRRMDVRSCDYQNFLDGYVTLTKFSSLWGTTRARGASLKIHLRSVATYWWFCLTHKWLLRRAVQEFGTKTRVWSCRYTEVLVITPNPNHAHLQTVWQPCLVVAGFQKIAGVLDQSETGNFVG